MQNRNLFKIFTSRLNTAKLNYIVTGSVAGIIYGEPRLTHDVDIIIHLKENDIAGLISHFPDKDFYVPPFEVIKTEIIRNNRGHFNIIHHETGFKADVYLVGNDPLHLFAFKNKKNIKTNGETVYFAPPEYVILRKLEYYNEGNSEKHLRDIKSILSNCPFKIDRQFIENNIKSAKMKQLFISVVRENENL
ncbi:MAG: hypothetical protein K9M56_09785 [Victivallales bacterium]|nr:hypothetical protein [Victivallales bacterium]